MSAPRSPGPGAAVPSFMPRRMIGSVAEGEQLVSELIRAMDGLLAVLERETELVRFGRLAAAAVLTPDKSELTRAYLAGAERVKANAVFLRDHMRARLQEVHRRHDNFRARLQINLTVLATAHAVSEGIVRGVAGEIARQSAPRTYGASGRAAPPGANLASPIAVSRSL